MMFLLLYFLLFISSIKTCPLKTVDIRSGCYCGIEIDGTNYIHCHPYSIDKIPEFTRSYIYDKLNLSKNFIENLTNNSFNQIKVKRIYLEENPIRFIDKQSFNNNNLLHYLEELYIDTITNQNLEFLCSGIWKKLRILKLSGFNFDHYQYCFDKLDRLEKLIIKNSEINLITHHIYKLPFLYELSLINNQIEYLNFDEQYLSYSSSIRILNLTLNHLQTIPNDLNIRLPHLITLDLSHNFIENLPLMNQITTLNINLSFNLMNYFQLNHNQHFIDLSSNPICTMEKTTKEISNILMNNLTNLHCDCRLAYFLKTNSIDQFKLFGNQTICATPQIFQGIFLTDLTYEQLINTCSSNLPNNCKEITNFKEIQQELMIENTTPIIETVEKLNNDNQNQISSFHLTSFYTHYENNDLLIFWDFDTSSSLIHLLTTKFQIIIEEQISSKTEIIRKSDFISPYLKQHIIPHLSSNKNYYVCLLFIRSSYGTDKYCRETKTLTNQTFFQILFMNRSIILGFLVGIILTTCLLITLAFICHLNYKQKHSHDIFNHQHQQQQQQRYMYVTRNEIDGTYSHSIVSSPYLLKKTHRRRTYGTPISPWYHRNLRQLSSNPRSPCCFLQYHDRTLSGSTTTNRITSLSSDYSNGIDKEQMTSTSLMSNTSIDEQQSQCIQSPVKHVYEELGDTNLFL